MEKQKRVLAIHDLCCVGKCSLTVAIPVLSAAGFEACAMPTAVFSAHTAFPSFTFRDLADNLMPMAEEVKKQGITFDAIYTGYLGTAAQTETVGRIIELFRAEKTRVLVDPVMGDGGRLYQNLTKDFPAGMLALSRKAAVITPNVTEAALLLGVPYLPPPHTEAYVDKLLRGLVRETGAAVVITGVSFRETEIGCALLNPEDHKIRYAMSGRENRCCHGTGDIFAAVLCAALLKEKTLFHAVQTAEEFVTDAIRHTGTEPENWYGVRFEDLLSSLPARIAGKQ